MALPVWTQAVSSDRARVLQQPHCPMLRVLPEHVRQVEALSEQPEYLKITAHCLTSAIPPFRPALAISAVGTESIL